MPDSTGIASIPSPFPVDVTLEKLKATIAGKGLQLFAHIDHRAGALAAGLDMQPAHVLIFGHAKAGTPPMVASPLLALDLPLIQRHSLPADLAKNISGVEPLVKAALGVT